MQEEMMVCILNGASSSGKSTISQQLVSMIDTPTVYHGFDFLIPSLLPHKESFASPANRNTRVYTRCLDEVLYQKIVDSGIDVLQVIYNFIPILHRGGLNVIVDTLLPETTIIPLFTILESVDTYFIGIRCSIEELNRREENRGDRSFGNAARTARSVHLHKLYDIEVDTEKHDAKGCAEQIIAHIRNTKPVAFSRMKNKYESGELQFNQ
jgi:chloramphenicol 3-O phosphotransferase